MNKRCGINMLDYCRLNQIINHDDNASICLDMVYQLAIKTYQGLSRFSIVTIKDNQVSNYFVRDKLTNCPNDELFTKKIDAYDSIANMVKHRGKRVIHDLNNISQNDRTVQLLNNGHRSSFSYPLVFKDQAIGMVFFNASDVGFFVDVNVEQDMLFLAMLIQAVMVRQIEKQQLIKISLSIALNMGHAKDPETKGHLRRMERYSSKLAYLLENDKPITHEFIRRIESYAAFHDIGKYKVPDSILFSTKIFTPEERKVMNLHCQHGIDIVDDVLGYFPENLRSHDEYAFLKNIVLHHHERFDGKGYPAGLIGDSIPLESRIIMVADVFDALLSKRLYKDAWSLDDVVGYMQANSGTMFDPDCIRVLIENLPEFIRIYEKYAD